LNAEGQIKGIVLVSKISIYSLLAYFK